CNWLSKKDHRTPCYSPSKEEVAKRIPANEVTEWECNWNADGYRMPTEAEWEYACRAGTKTPYFFGADPRLLASYAVCITNADFDVWPGGTKLPNAWGLFDTHGNVDEWCWDRYAREYTHEKEDPLGPRTGNERTCRGGSCFSPQNYMLRCDYRTGMVEPGRRSAHVGLRLVI